MNSERVIPVSFNCNQGHEMTSSKEGKFSVWCLIAAHVTDVLIFAVGQREFMNQCKVKELEKHGIHQAANELHSGLPGPVGQANVAPCLIPVRGNKRELESSECEENSSRS